MKRLLVIFFICCVLVITTFLLFGDLENWMVRHVHSRQSVATYTLLSFSFLSLDTLLPVPSSLLMILNGKVLGFWGGTVVSLLSSLVSSVFGFYLGRSAHPYFDKFFSDQDKAFSTNFFRRFGNLAITISKALPILSEAISFVAGTTAISFKHFLLYSTVGHLVVSVIYAYLGSVSNTIHSGIITALVIGATVLAGWLVQFFLKKERFDHS